MYDIDGDKELSIKEVEKMVIGLNQFSGNKKLNETDQPKKTAKKIFAKYDKDENGYKIFFIKILILFFIKIANWVIFKGILTKEEFMDELLTFPVIIFFIH